MLGVGTLLPLVILGIAKWGIVESPRWLVAQGRSSDAIDVLTTLAGPQAQPADVALKVRLLAAELRLDLGDRQRGEVVLAGVGALRTLRELAALTQRLALRRGRALRAAKAERLAGGEG